MKKLFSLILALMLVLRRAKRAYLFSFATAVIYGFALDAAMEMMTTASAEAIWMRMICYLIGMGMCSLGVACLFKTYIAPEAYELFVKEMAEKLSVPIGRMKTIYDCVSCAAAVAMSFAFFGFGRFEGVKLGTIVCALLNGWLIGRISDWIDRTWEIRDGLPLRKIFE